MSNEIRYLDTNRQTAPQTIYAKKLDKNSRSITIFVCNNGILKDLSSFTTTAVQIEYTKPDGFCVLNNATSLNEDGSVTFMLTEQMLAVSGEAIYDVKYTDTNGNICSTEKGKIYIDESAIDTNSVESSYEFNVLNKALRDVADVSETLDEVQEALTSMTSLIDTTTTSESERVSNEQTRISNEQERILNEQTRVANENTRQSQEETRQTNASSAITRCNSAAEACENIIENGVGISDTIIDETHAYSNIKTNQLLNNKVDGSRKQFELSTKGWYRIVEFVGDNLSSTKGGGGNGLHLSIKSNYMHNVSSCVDVILNASYCVSNFTILGKQSVGVITKLRHTNDESTGKSYVEIYYAYDNLNVVAIEISSVKAVYANIGEWSVINPIATTEAISSDVTIYGSTDLTTNTNTVLTGANIVNNQSTTVTGYAIDATQANPSIPGSLAQRDLKIVIPVNPNSTNSETEINNILNGLHNNATDGMYYRDRISLSTGHSILGGGQYYLEGFRVSSEYGWQVATKYSDVGITRFYRSINAGIWNTWTNS